ncbi:MAG: carbohydrate porin [Rhizomicrobium sp.]
MTARLPSALPLEIVAILCCGAPAWAQGWDGEKASLIRNGITPAIVYDGDVAATVSGGARRGTAYAGELHLQATFDGARLLDWPGAMLFVDGLVTHGGQPSGLAGDVQGVSSIAAPASAILYEAWAQYNLSGNAVSLLAGRYDINTEFYRLAAADLFLNSSFGIGPEFALSGVAGPSTYPDTAVGARFDYKPMPNIVVRTAILDGVPVDRPGGSSGLFESGDGVLLVSEIAWLDRPGAAGTAGNARTLIGRLSTLQPYADKIAIGGWHYTASFPDLSAVDASGQPARHRGSSGAYLLIDHVLYRDGDASRLSAFLQAGIGDGRVNRIGSYAGFGLAGAGFVPGRPSDQAGVAVAIAMNGGHFLEAQRALGTPAHAAESVIELTYLAAIDERLVVQPDLQYVLHPGSDPKLDDALVFQLRFEVSL